MQQNHIYRATFKRVNHLKQFILALFYASCSLPRLLIEVFIRVDFGERYFKLSTSIFVAILLGIIPPYIVTEGRSFELLAAIKAYPIWYGYLIAFLYFARLRHLEVKRNPSAFDFARFSESLGFPHPKIEAFFVKRFKRMPDMRIYEIYIEPLPFLLAGILLFIFHQLLGLLLIICSICYSVSYMAAYTLGDNKILDLIDMNIVGEETKALIVDGKSGRETRGVRFLFSRKPTTVDMREKLANSMMADHDEATDVN